MNTAVMEKPAKVAINGVDVPTLLATIGVVGDNTDLAKFQFRAKSEWVKGTHSRGTVNGFFGAGQEHVRDETFTLEGDHPTVFSGGDNGATPGELLLSALAACITAGIGNIASVRQVELFSVKTEVEGDMDMQGILGLNDNVRNGFGAIRARFEIKGDAPVEKLRQIVEQSIARSAVYDMLTNGTKVDIEVAA